MNQLRVNVDEPEKQELTSVDWRVDGDDIESPNPEFRAG
jgi:hypothetical protein